MGSSADLCRFALWHRFSRPSQWCSGSPPQKSLRPSQLPVCTMTSLLPVCLALLLPACVLGQLPIHYVYLIRKCQGNAGDTLEKCMETLFQYDPPSESNCTDVYNGAMKCSGDLFRECLPQEYRGLVPTNAMVTDMASYACQHMTEIESCWHGTRNLHCPAPNTTVDFVETVCTFLHDVVKCVKDVLPCSAFNTFLQKTIPPACGPGGTGVPLASTPLLIFAACALALLEMAAVL